MPKSRASSPAGADAAPHLPAGQPAGRVQVLLPLPLAGPYDYRDRPELALAPGDLVEVPLGGRRLAGVVWDVPDRTAPGPGGSAAADAGRGPVPDSRLKPVSGRLAVTPLAAPLRRLVDWVAWYTVSPPGAVLRMVLGAGTALAPPPAPAPLLRLAAAPAGLRITPARRRVLALLAEGPDRQAGELAAEAGVGIGVVRGLVEAGALEQRRPAAPPAPPAPDPECRGPALSADQSAAAEALAALVAGGGFSVTLLDGVTGSGKTEVYFEAVAAALRRGRQVLVMLPEIALSAQWLERFAARFGVPPAVWHSEIGTARRRAVWHGVAAGRVPVVVGARSALFLPFRDLGLIVVDEEHDAAFKQEEGVIYHARDMAVVRARLEAVPAVLVSATPSLETIANAEAGRYGVLHLPDRFGPARLPQVAAVDMRRHAPGRQRWISEPLAAAITETLAAGEQAMLFLNRRGYAPLTLCRRCGHRMQCPNCTAWLVEHRLVGRLACHHCGFGMRTPHGCPACGAEDALVPCGPGVERLAEEVASRFPEARLEVATSDTLAGPGAAARLTEAMAARSLDIVIGTQVLTKGHHFPLLTLVGVIDADLGLSGGDLRAAERTWQLLDQVAGRAGRAEHRGRVLLQTFQPDHPVLQALVQGRGREFLAAEAEERRRRHLPPFGRLVALIVSGPDEPAVDAVAAALARAAPRGAGIQVLGPAPAPLAVLRGRHRRRLLLRAERGIPVQGLVSGWLAAVAVPGRVRVQADIDPYSFL